MSLLLVCLFAVAAALVIYMLVDLFKDIPRSKEVLSPLEREYLASAFLAGPVRPFLAAQALKIEEEDFRLVQAEWQAHFPPAIWRYEIERTQDGISITVGLRADANASIRIALPPSATRGDVLRAGMAQVHKQWGL